MESTTQANKVDQSGTSNEKRVLMLDDVVCLATDANKIGIITRVYVPPDDQDNTEEEQELSPDSVEVEWVLQETKNLEVVKIESLVLLDRSLLHGDIVVKKGDTKGQTGTVVGVQQLLDIQFNHEEKLHRVPAKFFRPIQPFQREYYVVKDYWLGQIADYIVDVTVQFADGSVCIVKRADPAQLKPESSEFKVNEDDEDEEEEYDDYYPGQKVFAEAKVFKHATWIKGGFKHNTRGVVIEVNPARVEVDWVMPYGDTVDFPNMSCKADSLHLLDYYVDVNWQVGDRGICFPELRIAGNVKPETLKELESKLDSYEESESNEEQSDSNSKKSKRARKRAAKSHSDLMNTALVICTHTLLDVRWQDGTLDKSIDARELDSVDVVLDEDFWPEDYVIEKESTNTNKVGVVLKANHADRVCDVKWMDDSTWTEISVEEQVPVLSLQQHPTYDYQLGDIVFLLDDGKDEQKESEDTENGESSDEDCARRAGEVIAFENGKIQVHWANGSESWVLPNQLLKFEDEDQDLNLDDEGDEEDDEEYDDGEEEYEVYIEDTGAPAQPATNPNSSWWLESEAESYDISKFHEAANMYLQRASAASDSVSGTSTPAATETSSSTAATSPITSPVKQPEEQTKFKGFDMLPEVSDHKFKHLQQHSQPAKFARLMLAEWDRLSTSLPEGIYIRGFENRMDLLKVLIVGPPQTPYADCLFLFDMYLPPEYPEVPPQVHFCSYSTAKLNPNLYPEGKVCLSLLGTFTGSGVEVWSPSKSNILQVVVSIQGLILGSQKPYFLEAGYDKLRGTEHGEYQAELYNETAYLLSLQSIPLLLANPPKEFDKFIREHFKQRAKHILSHCASYLPGDKSEATKDVEKIIKTPSLGLQKLLEKLYPRLKEALQKLEDEGEDKNSISDSLSSLDLSKQSDGSGKKET